MSDQPITLEQLLNDWPESQADLKNALLELKEYAQNKSGAVLNFVSRPGVTHSLRFDLDPRPAGRQRQVFFLTDVIEAADELFLSVCYYEDEITDPDELGNAIPRGLFDETGYCFDLDEPDDDFMVYLKARIDEGYQKAIGQ